MFDLTEDKPKLSVSEPIMLGRTYERCWMNKVEIKREWIEVFSSSPGSCSLLSQLRLGPAFAIKFNNGEHKIAYASLKHIIFLNGAF